jgi:hypothetical protein
MGIGGMPDYELRRGEIHITSLLMTEIANLFGRLNMIAGLSQILQHPENRFCLFSSFSRFSVRLHVIVKLSRLPLSTRLSNFGLMLTRCRCIGAGNGRLLTLRSLDVPMF